MSNPDGRNWVTHVPLFQSQVLIELRQPAEALGNVQISRRVDAKANRLVGIGFDVKVIRAQQSDLDRVLEILEEASQWLSSKGLESQWRASPAFRQTIKDNISCGDVYVVKDAEGIVGTITLQWSDEKFWGDLPREAGYLHKLAIKRSQNGKRLGFRLLQWAEAKARAEGKMYLRLDCLASNKTIRDYYEKAGFTHIRDTLAPGWKASLYEKKL